MKVVAMIPARKNSKRVPKKNLRYLGGKPLIQYVIDTVKKSQLFDEIYINSDDPLMREIATKNDVLFYERDVSLARDHSTNDEFVYDFLKNVECDYLCQVLPTGPFITTQDLKKCVLALECSDNVVSVKEEQISAVYRKRAINFEYTEQLPRSQDLKPVLVYASNIMIWNKQQFIMNMDKIGCGYHSPRYTKSYVSLEGLSGIDIDTESDFKFAEQVLPAYMALNEEEWPSHEVEPQYYGDACVEACVPEILEKDGIEDGCYSEENSQGVAGNVFSLIDGQKSKSHRIINTEHNSCTLITQVKGEGNRRHFHPNWDEWWYIVDGEWNFEIEGEITLVKQGDIVYIPKGKVHKITAKSETASRLAVSRSDIPHIYVDKEG